MDPWEGPKLVFGPAGLEQTLTAEDEAFYNALEAERVAADDERERQRLAEAGATEKAYERWRENGMDDGILEIAGVPPSRIAR